MLKIQEELLKDTAFYREAFEEGEARGALKGKLEAVPPLRELGLSDETIAERLNLSLADARSAPKANGANGQTRIGYLSNKRSNQSLAL